ncbi:MAG TPA: hypothetical protein PK593_09700, partial [Thermomicrobiales bacterium]|nr:hypothetical protein [Thermomicrobiales bacterium]
LHGVMLKDTRPWGEFFAGLDLVITYDIDHYTSIVGANAAQVFRRLRLVTAAAGGKLQFTATARPAANLEAFATALFGIDPSVDHVHRYAVDGSARPEQTFGVWLPPLDRYGEAGVGGHAVARVRRQSALAAAVELASVLVSLTDDYRLLVHCYDRGRVDAEWLSNEIDRAVGMSLPEQRLRVTTEEAELSGRQAHYDGLIILGTPEHVSEIERLCGQLGGERRGGLALVLGTHSPAALHMIRSFHTSGSIDFLDTRARTQLTINTRHADVVAKHLACAVHETRMRRSQIVETFGLPGVQAADALVANGFAAWQDVVADRSVFGYQDSVLILVRLILTLSTNAAASTRSAPTDLSLSGVITADSPYGGSTRIGRPPNSSSIELFKPALSRSSWSGAVHQTIWSHRYRTVGCRWMSCHTIGIK